ncbi:MAG: hypothetical protein WBA89_14650 [Microcoleus sp.]
MVSPIFTIARDRPLANFQRITETRYIQKYRVSFRLIRHLGPVFGKIR